MGPLASGLAVQGSACAATALSHVQSDFVAELHRLEVLSSELGLASVPCVLIVSDMVANLVSALAHPSFRNSLRSRTSSHSGFGDVLTLWSACWFMSFRHFTHSSLLGFHSLSELRIPTRLGSRSHRPRASSAHHPCEYAQALGDHSAFCR
jgi:hypothetical protein